MKLNGRRAQSTVIEALMMLLITVVASSLVYGFSLSALSAQRQGPMLQVRERLLVENVFFTTSAGLRNQINITVRNIGTVDVNIVNATVSVRERDLSVKVSFPLNKASLPLASSQMVGWLNCTFIGGVTWNSGESYKIVLVSERGSRFVVEEVA